MDHNTIKQILLDHETWIESDHVEGKRAIFDGADLQNADLKDVDLRHARFRNADLSEADLRGADLRGADFIGANLSKANLYFADLRRSNLHGANLENAELYSADLREANLRNAILKDAHLQSADLQGALLDNADFSNASLTDIKINQKALKHIPEIIRHKYKQRIFSPQSSSRSYESIVRSIEFPPEYQQAGISILSYFGTVLRQKHPDEKSKIKIEQEDSKVTLIIETEKGNQEKIEKDLDNYGLVITGQITPEEYTEDKHLILGLRNELTYAKARIESQRDLIQYQQGDISRLNQLLLESIRKPLPAINVSVPVTSIAEAKAEFKININQRIKLIQKSLGETANQFPDESEEFRYLKNLQEALDKIDDSQSPKQVSKSTAMSKVKEFLENVDKADTVAGKIIKTLKNGIDTARKIAGFYNDIAQWCGLPQVPKPLTK